METILATQKNEDCDKRIMGDINPLALNPYNEEFRLNPYELYQRMQNEYPVYRYRTTVGTEWMVTRFEDIKKILNNSDFIVENLPARVPPHNELMQSEKAHIEHLKQSLSPWLFSLDPPRHNQLRQLVSRDFTSTALQKIEPYIECLVNSMFDGLKAGELDLINDIAKPLPLLVSAKLLGLSIDDLPGYLRCAENLFKIFEQPLTYRDIGEMSKSALFFSERIEQELSSRRFVAPKDDLLAKLDKSSLNESELKSFCVMLFAVGQETTENYIGNAIAALLGNSEQYELLRDNPALIDNAICELARFDSAVQIISRVASAPTKMHDAHIAKGDRVYLCLGAANRDPRQYENPDKLDITRDSKGNFPFGSGIHFCLGSVLAKLQLKYVLKKIIALPQFTLNTSKPALRRKTVVIRGYHYLPFTIQ